MRPEASFAIDGKFETFLTVLDQMAPCEVLIAAETAHYLPFLMTTTIMMEAVKAGVGRETAHLAIKEHALATVADLRAGTLSTNNLADRLASDARLGLDRATLDAILARGANECGAAHAQTRHFIDAIGKIAAAHPQAAPTSPARSSNTCQ
jgi:adenylosuccinate lyase